MPLAWWCGRSGQGGPGQERQLRRRRRQYKQRPGEAGGFRGSQALPLLLYDFLRRQCRVEGVDEVTSLTWGGRGGPYRVDESSDDEVSVVFCISSRDTYSLTLAPGALLLVLLVPAVFDSLSGDSSGSDPMSPRTQTPSPISKMQSRKSPTARLPRPCLAPVSCNPCAQHRRQPGRTIHLGRSINKASQCFQTIRGKLLSLALSNSLGHSLTHALFLHLGN